MTQEKQNEFYEQLEQLTSEQVLRAFTHWHGMQLLTDEFLEFCIGEGYIEPDIEHIDIMEELEDFIIVARLD